MQKLHGLVAATHTPFHADGTLNLAPVEAQCAHLLKNGITMAFIGGSTGESHSVSLTERKALAERWAAVAKGTPMKVIVHAGANCLDDSAALARHAQEQGAIAVSALAPSYFKPSTLDLLIASCAKIASAAPGIPFYYYDIPVLTGVNFSMPDFLAAAPARIPNLAGIKFTNPNLMMYLECLRADGGKWDIPWGNDEWMLGALATGAKGSVGSSFNFAAPVYQRLIAAFERGDMVTAREEQFRSVRIIKLLASHGYMAAAKATMGFLGVDVGQPRLPTGSLSPDAVKTLRGQLETMGVFDWIR
ncbi:MAG: dihydrodipicolinate synthase family protein [Kiritimatiellia bacterium]